MQSDFVFSSESVTRGHPDKLCDQISDAIVGNLLHHDRGARVVAECAISTGVVFVSARLNSDVVPDLAGIARRVIEDVGYDHPPFSAKACTVMTSLIRDRGADRAMLEAERLDDDQIERIAAHEQVTVFGFACDHTPAHMPLPIWLANKLVRRVDEVRKSGTLDYLAPDGKTQVAVEFRNGRPHRIHAVTLRVSQKHEGRPSERKIAHDLETHVLEPAFSEEPIRPDERTRIVVNPGGPIVGGGPFLHAGLTGRKGGVDTYGEFARRGDSALSGKDLLRVERIGAYAARHAAKNVVLAKLARICEVQLSYSYGEARPTSVQVETFGTGQLSEDTIAHRLERAFDFRLAGIVRRFRLSQLDPLSIYPQLSAYGHFGRTDLSLPWEGDESAGLRS